MGSLSRPKHQNGLNLNIPTYLIQNTASCLPQWKTPRVCCRCRQLETAPRPGSSPAKRPPKLVHSLPSPDTAKPGRRTLVRKNHPYRIHISSLFGAPVVPPQVLYDWTRTWHPPQSHLLRRYDWSPIGSIYLLRYGDVFDTETL